MAEQQDFSMPHEPKSLGIAGRTARLFITSPVTPMLLIAALLVGLLGLFFTPRQEDPQISVPMVDIFVQYPGASAQQVASLVTEPLERIMKEIPGVRHTYTATERGSAMVTVRFFVGEDMGESIVKVHDKLQSNMDKIPPDVSMPLVKPVAVDDVPVVTLTLWSEDVDDGALRTLALDLLQRLGEVPNAGKGFIVGGREDQLKVEVLPERLSGFGISLPQVAETIRTANAEKTAGGVESGGTSMSVRTGAFLKTASDIEHLVVGVRNGAPVYVRDVARVSHEPADPSRMVAHYTGPAYEGKNPVADGAPAVTIAIAKKEKTNGVFVANALLEKIESFKGDLIPANVHVEITRNYGKTANDKVNELLKAMLEAACFVALLCLYGLGYRAAFVVITVIPIVILVTIWWAMMVDYTIDRVSLFALIFSIGILVDDATVVIENIFRHWLEQGKTSVAIAVDAVREVGNPTIIATLTIISALLPMGWVSGLMGPYMRPIPVLGSSAMFFSLVAAFIFTPWFAVKVAPRMASLEKASKKEIKTHQKIARIYRPIITPLIDNRFLGITFLVTIIGLTAGLCVLFYTQTVVVKMLPFDNKPEFSVIVNMPEGTAMPVTANVVACAGRGSKENAGSHGGPDLYRDRPAIQLQRDGAALLPAPAHLGRRSAGHDQGQEGTRAYQPSDRRGGASPADADSKLYGRSHRGRRNAARTAGAADGGRRGPWAGCRNPAQGGRRHGGHVREGSQCRRRRQLHGRPVRLLALRSRYRKGRSSRHFGRYHQQHARHGHGQLQAGRCQARNGAGADLYRDPGAALHPLADRPAGGSAGADQRRQDAAPLRTGSVRQAA